MPRITKQAALFLWVLAAVMTTACSSIECPLNNHVYYVLTLDGDTLTDTLTVSTTRRDGNDTVLVNRNINTTQLALPSSYAGETDDFLFDRVSADGKRTVDTVSITKDNKPHFESVDCSPAYFHTLREVRTTHHGIDSISIENENVTYDQSHAHIKIHFKPSL